jgi:hypothetical protein
LEFVVEAVNSIEDIIDEFLMKISKQTNVLLPSALCGGDLNLQLWNKPFFYRGYPITIYPRATNLLKKRVHVPFVMKPTFVLCELAKIVLFSI